MRYEAMIKAGDEPCFGCGRIIKNGTRCIHDHVEHNNFCTDCELYTINPDEVKEIIIN